MCVFHLIFVSAVSVSLESVNPNLWELVYLILEQMIAMNEQLEVTCVLMLR